MSEYTADTRPPVTHDGLFVRMLRWAWTLAVLHVFVALNLIPVLGGFVLIYAIFPPFLLWVAWDFVQRTQLLTALALGPCIAFAPALLGPLRARTTHLGRLKKSLMWTGIAIWLPIASAEALRALLVHTQIAVASPQCHSTETLLASLRRSYDFDPRHGSNTWLVRNGEIRWWSDETLRFEPLPDRVSAEETAWSADERCPDSRSAND